MCFSSSNSFILSNGLLPRSKIFNSVKDFNLPISDILLFSKNITSKFKHLSKYSSEYKLLFAMFNLLR